MRRPLTTAAVASLAGMALLAGSGCVPAPGSDPAIEIGAIYPAAGPQGPGGAEELEGVRVGLELSRRRGDRWSQRITLRTVPATTPADASAAMGQLAAARVPAVIGTYGSSLAEAAAARADQEHIVYWETGAVADMITANRSYVFRTVATGSTLGRTAVDFTAGVLVPAAGLPAGKARVAILAVDDLYGRSVADEEVAALSRSGLDLVGRIDYNPRAYDPAAIAVAVAKLAPTHLLGVSYVTDGVAIWRQLLRLGLPLSAAVGTSSAFCSPEFGHELGADAVGLFAADKPDASIGRDALSPAARDLLKEAAALYAKRNHGARMAIPAVAGFVGGWALFHDVLPRIGGRLSADAIRAAAYQVDLPAGSSINGGGLRFAPPESSSAGQNLLAASVVGQWQEAGTMRVVYPAGFAVAEPRLAPLGSQAR